MNKKIESVESLAIERPVTCHIGLVLRVPIVNVPDIERSLRTIPDIRILYQTLSAGRIYIKKDPEPGIKDQQL